MWYSGAVSLMTDTSCAETSRSRYLEVDLVLNNDPAGTAIRRDHLFYRVRHLANPHRTGRSRYVRRRPLPTRAYPSSRCAMGAPLVRRSDPSMEHATARAGHRLSRPVRTDMGRHITSALSDCVGKDMDAPRGRDCTHRQHSHMGTTHR